MATGTGTLWHANFKINTDEHGFNFKVHMAEIDEATAKSRAIDLAGRIKKLIPSDASIYYATISKDNTKKDSRYLKDAIGPGEYVLPGVDPDPSTYDYSKVALLIRLEHADGSSVTRKFNPIPDNFITDGALLSSITAVEGMPGGALPAVGAGATWYEEFTNFMKALVKNTHHVVAGHAPGGEYTYYEWVNAFVLRVGDKKGGRVFSL